MILKKLLTKKVFSLSLIALISCGHTNTNCVSDFIRILKNPTGQALVATTAATTCSTIYCWYKKRQVSKELERLTSGEIQKENAHKLLAEIGQYIDTVNQKFEAEILLAKSKANLYQEEYIERCIFLAKQKRNIAESISIAYLALSAYKKDLEINIADWDKTQSAQAYVIKSKEIFKELSTLENLFKDISQSIKSQLNFIDLSLLMDRDNLSEYSRELELSKELINQQYIIELDKIVRSKGEAGNPFPYLSYASKLKNQIDVIKNILEKLKGAKLFVFQERVLIQANEFTVSLNRLLESVVSISSFQQEQGRKPEYDKQQRLLAAELKEREEKILREKQLVETKLMHERNKEQNLANERSKIERDRQALILQERNMVYEIERIRNGQALKEELAKEAIKNEKFLKSEIEKTKSESQKDLILKEQELMNIKYEMQNLDYQKRQTDNKLNDVYNNIAICKQHIQNLQTKLNTPPCNPESVNGLPEYLKNLKDLANNAAKSV